MGIWVLTYWILSEVGGHLNLGRFSSVDPNVHLRLAAMVPDDGWAFDAPVVPWAVVAHVVFMAENQVAIL